jgi:hypothetical protein
MGYENSGRRPTPTALTVLRGNPSKKKLNENEPRPPSGEIGKPAGLSAGAAGVWDELAPVAVAMGTLTTADLKPFATLCELQATLQQASSQKDNAATAQAGIKLEKEVAAVIRPYYALFGLEPVSRARLAVPSKDKEPASKWAGLI